VNASDLKTLAYRLYTSINVADSLTDGISYFYAEVKRLKSLMEAYQEDDRLPLFFLIDEIYRGTNNREREIGSRAYVRSLVGGRGVGLISTHDLALVHLADNQAHIQNYHFREQVHGNRMIFDYRLQPGPCPTTNALKIMSIEGLPVE
jgi:DNA mismatch repair ATPase MutS